MTVTPGANTDKVDITYTDEDDKPQTITVSKGPAGQWLATGVPENQGITVDAATGAVKLPPDAVKDNSPVQAVAHNGGNPTTASEQITSDNDGITPPPPANHAPTLEVSVTLHPEQGQATEGQQVATSRGADQDGDSLTYSLTPNSDPNGYYSIDPATGTVSLTAAGAAHVNAGEDLPAVSVTVSDGKESVNASGNVDKTIDTPQGEAPNANDDNLDGLKIGATATINVLTNDRDAQGDIDPTTVQLLDGSGNKVKTLEVSGEGTWNVANDGTVTFSPAAGFTGSPTPVKYTVSDKAGHESQPATITLTYESVPLPLDPPTFQTGIGEYGDAFTVTPATGATKMVIEYQDEGTPPATHTVTVTKDANTGKWSADSSGYDVEADTGKIRFEPDQVLDESKVTAVNSNATQTSSPAEITTGIDKNEPRPEKPDVQEGEEQGSVVITPKERTDSLDISYTDEATGTEKRVTVSKANDGWKLDGDPIEGITVDAETGKTTLAAKVVQDGSTVSISAISIHSSFQGETSFVAGNNPPTLADPEQPLVAKGADAEQGGVTITPQGNTDKVVITYKDEQNADHTITVTKTSGQWTAEGVPDNQGITVDAASGAVKLPPDAVGDKTEVKAVAHNGTNPTTAENSVTSDVDNTAPQPPQPSFTQPALAKGEGAEQGGVTITPPDEATYLRVDYEGNGQARSLTLTRADASSPWQVQDGTQKPAGVDFDATSGVVKVAPAAVDDNTTLSAIAGKGTAYSDRVSVTTDPDSGTPQPVEAELTLSGDGNVVEGESAAYTLTLNKAADSDVTVTVTIKHGTTDDGNVKTETRSITIPKGETGHNFEVAALDNDSYQPNRTFNVSVESVTGAVNKAEAVETTIADNDPPPAPTLAAGSENGSVVVTPQTVGGIKSLVITYRDNDDNEQTLTVARNDSGKWTSADLPRDNISLDENSGVVTLGGKALKDGSPVSAHNDSEYKEGTSASLNAGYDNGQAPVNQPGSVIIEGEAKVGSELTAKVSDGNGFAEDSVQYQWLRDGEPISAATNKAYTLTNDDAGHKISVHVEYTDNIGTAEKPTSDAQDVPNVPPANENHAPTDITLDTVRVSEGKVGVAVGKLSTTDQDAADTHTYTMSDERFEVTADGTLKLKAGEYLNYAKEQTVTLKVTTTDNHGAAFTKDITLEVVDDPNFPATSANAKGGTSFTTNSGFPQVGETLTASIFDSDGIDHSVPKYTWFVDGSQVGQGETYVVKASDAGKRIKVRAEYVDDAGHIENVESFAALVGGKPKPPAQNHAPTDITLDVTQVIEGKDGVKVGKLTTTDEDKGDTHTYTVSDSRFEVVDGTLKLKAGEHLDFAKEPTVKLTVTTNDGHGGTFEKEFTLQVQDDPDYPATPQPPQNHAPTDIDLGATQVMEGKDGAEVGKLTTTDEDKGDTHTYTVSDSRFEVVDGMLKLKAGEHLDLAKEPTVKLTVTTDDGHGGTFSKEFTLQVQDDPAYPPVVDNGSITISGTAKVGETLTANVVDPDGVAEDAIRYQWLANGQPINGATEKTYTLRPNDVGKSITVKAEYDDNIQHHENPGSEATGKVQGDGVDPTVSLIGPGEVPEGGKATYTAMLDKATDHDVTVSLDLNYYLSGAKDGSISLSNKQVTIPAGETRATFTASVADNNEVNDRPENPSTGRFGIEITGASGAKVNDAAKQLKALVIDDEAALPSLTLNTDQPSLTEGGTATYTVTLSKATDHPVTVDIDFVPFALGIEVQNASDNDVTLSTKRVTIPAGETQATFTVTANADSTAEGVEGFSINLINPKGATLEHAPRASAAQNDSVYSTIADSDGEAVVSLVGRDAVVREGEGIGYKLQMNKAVDHDVRVTVEFGGGEYASFKEGDQQTYVIPKGKTSVDFTLTTHDNNVAQSYHGGLQVAIKSAEGARAITDVRYNVNILDNNPPVTPTIVRDEKTGDISITSGMNLSNPANRDSMNQLTFMEIHFTDPSGQAYKLITQKNVHGVTEWAFDEVYTVSPASGITLNTQTGTVTIPAHMLKAGSEVTAQNYNDAYGSANSEVATVKAGEAPQAPHIAPEQPLVEHNHLADDVQDVGHEQHDVDSDNAHESAEHTAQGTLHLSPEINAADYSQLVNMEGEDILNHLGQHSAEILAKTTDSGSLQNLHGSDGDDIFVAAHGAHQFSGGKGADTFAFLFDGNDGHGDKILDFNPAEGDRIVFAGEHLAGAKLTLEEHGESQRLSISDSEGHTQTVDIVCTNGKLSEKDILTHVKVMTPQGYDEPAYSSNYNPHLEDDHNHGNNF